jgi:uncharacterized protein (TIGR02996 family)
MNPTETAFLRDICDQPADRAVRLIYADWLDEHRGDDPASVARARFIRLQCELENLDPGDVAFIPRQAEVEALRQEHQWAWAGGLRGITRDFEFRGGFVEGIKAALGALIQHGDRLRRIIPLRAMNARSAVSRWPAFLSGHHTTTLEELDVSFNFPDSRYLEQAAAALNAPALRKLVLDRNPIPVEPLRTLLAGRALPRLEEMSLLRCGIPGAVVEAIATSPVGQALRSLQLSLLVNSAADLDALREGPWPRLERLRLDGTPMPAAAFVQLIRAPWWARLREVILEGGEIGEAHLGDLLSGPTFGAPLESLSLLHCQGGPAGPLDLAEVPWTTNLRELRLAGSDFRRAYPVSQVVLGLGNNARLTRLHTLQVQTWGHVFSDDALGALIAIVNRNRIRRLDLSLCYLGDAGVAALATAPGLEHVQHLNLFSNPLGNPAGEALADCPALDGLLKLNLAGNTPFSTPIRERLAARFPFVVF